MRLDDLQRERGRDGGIEGVAALLQRRHADGRGNPVRRGDDAERAFDFRARRERVGIDNAHAGGKLTRRRRRATGSIVLRRAGGYRHEFERDAVHAVAKSGRLGSVVEDVAEVAAAAPA